MRHPLVTPVTTIGRDRSSTIRLNDSAVSRCHAIVIRQDDRWWIIDQQSANGLQINDKRVDRHALVNEDMVEFGAPRTRMVYRDDALWSSDDGVVVLPSRAAVSAASPWTVWLIGTALLLLLILGGRSCGGAPVNRLPVPGDVGRNGDATTATGQLTWPTDTASATNGQRGPQGGAATPAARPTQPRVPSAPSAAPTASPPPATSARSRSGSAGGSGGPTALPTSVPPSALPPTLVSTPLPLETAEIRPTIVNIGLTAVPPTQPPVP